MAICPIVPFPDQRLRDIAQPVTLFDDALHALSVNLLDTLRAAPGTGITAPHIGVLLRVVALELPDDQGAKTYINPEIIWSSQEQIKHQEGSISMPGAAEQIERAARITLRYHDLSGNEHLEESDGLRAVCHQHEIDQLNGIFWIQRLSPLKRSRLVARYEKLSRHQRSSS